MRRSKSFRATMLAGCLWLVATTPALYLTGCGATDSARQVSGKAVFARHCSTCHSIGVPATPRQQGGELSGYRLTRLELTQYAAEMPVIHGRMTARELRAVVDYLLAVEHH